MHRKMFDKVLSDMSPKSQNEVTLGRVFSARGNPDIEVNAFVLERVPVSDTAFKTLADGKDWYIVNFLVTKVGPVGFSSVPYQNNKKVKDKKDLLPLYEETSDGIMMHSFEKAMSNKDKGVRVTSYTTEEGVEKMLCANIVPGMILSRFVTSDNVKDNEESNGIVNLASSKAQDSSGFFFYSQQGTLVPPVLEVGSPVVLHIRAKNKEQATKGSLVNIVRVMIIADTAVSGAFFNSFPDSFEGYKDVERGVCECESLQNCTKMRRASYCQISPDEGWWCSCGENGGLVFSNSENDIVVNETVLKRALYQDNNTDFDINVARRFMDIAFACKAVSVLVKDPVVNGITYGSEVDAALKRALLVVIDQNKLLGLHSMTKLGYWPDNQDILSNKNEISIKLLKSGDEEYLICVQRDSKVVCGEDPSSMMSVLTEINMQPDVDGSQQESHVKLSMSKPQQKHYSVRLGVVKQKDWNLSQVNSLDEWISSEENGVVKFYCDLHYAPGMKSVGNKRMRESLDA